ncbi:hypothetical protein GCM10010439_12290 [Actinocorallia aurantiaca]|uniref:Uncharacterized protein n=1 Tax=Actinocorallia aurantiaca TaxID=46204 RepID=A0ABN3TZL6_9ACTN
MIVRVVGLRQTEILEAEETLGLAELEAGALRPQLRRIGVLTHSRESLYRSLSPHRMQQLMHGTMPLDEDEP